MPEAFECESDEQAMAVAAGLGERVKLGFDLWQLDRFVGRFELGADSVPRPLQGPFAHPDPRG